MLESIDGANIIMWIVLDIVISSVCLWCAAKITVVETSYVELLPAVVVSSIVLPFAGTFVSAIVLFIILHKMLEADIWPDLILMVAVSRGVVLLGSMILSKLF